MMTMEVKVVLRATLARYSKNHRGSVFLNLREGSRLAKVLSLLGVPEEEVYLALINQKQASLSDELHDGDQIELVPPIAGG